MPENSPIAAASDEPVTTMSFRATTDRRALTQTESRLASIRNSRFIQRHANWVIPLVLLVIASISRLWNLGSPQALVFDETYYVKDAWSQWQLGYTANWPEGANDRFIAGDVNSFNTSGSFIVHPPLGKWLIGLGMWAFGPEPAFSWRISAAIFGIATVLVLYYLTKTLTKSRMLATGAAFFLAIDGLGISMSRVGLLDIFLTFFVVLAIWFAALDYQRSHKIFRRRVEGDDFNQKWGPFIWNRPWLLAAGVAAGCASSVKWSGLFFLAAIGVFTVIVDGVARRKAGVWYWPTATFIQGLVSFVILVPVAAVIYLLSWLGWFLGGANAWGRQTISLPDDAGWFETLLNSWQNFWQFQLQIYSSASGIVGEHSYDSPAWQWALLSRPTSMYFHLDQYGDAGCSWPSGCVENINSMPNPLLWYAGVIAIFWLLYRFIISPRWSYGLVLLAIAAGWLPWFMYPERTIFQFYTIVFWPFMLIALVWMLRSLAGAKHSPIERRLAGGRLLIIFFVAAVILSAFWFPTINGIEVPYLFWQSHNWYPGWV